MSTKKKEATVNQDRPIMILEKRGSEKKPPALRSRPRWRPVK